MIKEYIIENSSIKWYRCPLDKNNLKNLSQTNNFIGLFYLSIHILLLLITGTLTYHHFQENHWFLTAFFLFIHGTFFSFLGMAGLSHELLHKTVFKTKFLNDFCLALFSFLTWNNYRYYQTSHLRHHLNTVYKNIDGEVILPQSYNLKIIVASLTFDIFAFYRIIKILIENSLGIVKGKFSNVLFPLGSKKRLQLCNFARIMLLGQIIMASIFIYFGYWPLIFIINLAPFIATWLNKLLSLAQHMGMQPNVNDYRLNTRTVILNPFLAFLYWQMNYHVEHHMYPGVPFFNLRKLRKLIESDLPIASIGIISTFKTLQKANKNIKENE